MSDRLPMPREPSLDRRYIVLRSPQRLLPALEGSWQCRLYSARNAIFHALRAFAVPRGAKVLVPAYLCRAAIEPILQHGANVCFYRIDADCCPDYADVERKLTADVAAVLAVHYFGIPTSMRRFRALCDATGARLIEDCAHVLTGSCDGVPLGSSGDAGVFSWRKFLPISDGATLLINAAGYPPDFELAEHGLRHNAKVVWNIVERSLERPKRRHGLLRGAMRIAASARKRLRGGAAVRAGEPAHDDSGDSFDPGTVNLPMSPFCRMIAEHSDVAAIADSRRNHFEYLCAALSRIDGLRLLHRVLPSEAVPWVCPIVVDQGAAALQAIRRRGVPAVSWSGVRSPSLPRGLFPEADSLYEDLLFLPVHQGLRPADLERIVQAVASVVGEGAERERVTPAGRG